MEKHEKDSCANCHKDFCDCVKKRLKQFKVMSRNRNVSSSINFLIKNNISFQTTNVENIVTTEYWGEKIYISLKTFKLRKEGSNVWVEKKRKLINQSSKLEFGKHKGLTFEEVLKIEKDYLVWVDENTDILLDRALYDLMK
jgi:hypothetical protein